MSIFTRKRFRVNPDIEETLQRQRFFSDEPIDCEQWIANCTLEKKPLPPIRERNYHVEFAIKLLAVIMPVVILLVRLY